MALVTIQLLEGLERGRVHSDLPTPVTIGREEENTIRLNDERVSRFHAKIQEDNGRIILTDLDSTNGTRVNGHPVQMRVLQIGDQVSIGRCLLLYGSREAIARRLREFPGEDGTPFREADRTVRARPDDLSSHHGLAPDGRDSSSDSPFRHGAQPALEEPEDLLFPEGMPGPPEGLRPFQRAELSDLIAFIHERLRTLLQAGRQEPAPEHAGEPMQSMLVQWDAWQRLLNLEMDLAELLRKLAEPGE